MMVRTSNIVSYQLEDYGFIKYEFCCLKGIGKCFDVVIVQKAENVSISADGTIDNMLCSNRSMKSKV